MLIPRCVIFLQPWKGMSWTSAAVLTSCNSLHLAGPRHCCLNSLNLVVMYILVVKVLVQLMLECLLKDDTNIGPGGGKFLCVQKGAGSCQQGTGQRWPDGGSSLCLTKQRLSALWSPLTNVC